MTRLFLVPLLIVVMVVGAMIIMSLVARLAGPAPSIDQAIANLKNDSGGQRTAGWLVGPGAKQRYIDAKALTDQMKSGMSEAQRIKLADDLLDILEHHTRPDEGNVEYFILLALGRVWQLDPQQPPMNSPQALDSRQKVVAKLVDNARAKELYPKTSAQLANLSPPELSDYKSQEMSRRKAAILALAFWPGRAEVRSAFPALIQLTKDDTEDLDVRMAAATALGPIAGPQDQDVIDALSWTMNNTTKDELIWDAAASLAQLNQSVAKDTMLMLLDRHWLASKEIDDPESTQRRLLSEEEQQRIIINAMEAAAKLQLPEIHLRIQDIAAHDPSPRVRQAAQDVLSGHPVWSDVH